MEEENYKYRLDKLQDKFLDIINEKEIDVVRANILMIEFLQLGTTIAQQMQYRVQNKITLSPAFQESLVQIAHIKNISEILRKRLGLIK